MTEAGLRIFKKKKKRTRKCLFEKAPKKNYKCADETSERERMRERMKEARESIEGKTYKRERGRKREFDGEKKWKRRPRSRKIWRAIMCPIDFGDMVNQENRESRRSFDSSIESRRNPKRNLYARGGSESFNGTFRSRDFQSIFQRSAIIQPLTWGRWFMYFKMSM